MNFESSALVYIRNVLNELRISPTALAKKAGISSTTLTRALNDPKHKFTLSMTTLQKIATATGINPAPYLESRDVAELNTNFLWRTDEYLDDRSQPKNTDEIRVTLIVGEAAANKWIEPSVVAFSEYGPMLMTASGYKAKDCFGVVVRGDSADMLADDGEVLFCIRIDALQHPLRSAPVIVERRSKDNFKLELTARFLLQTGEGWELLSLHSKDNEGKKAKYFEPIRLSTLTAREDLKIIGCVDYVVRDTADVENYFWSARRK